MPLDDLFPPNLVFYEIPVQDLRANGEINEHLSSFCKTKTKTSSIYWSQTGLVLRPTVSDHITVQCKFITVIIITTLWASFRLITLRVT